MHREPACAGEAVMSFVYLLVQWLCCLPAVVAFYFKFQRLLFILDNETVAP